MILMPVMKHVFRVHSFPVTAHYECSRIPEVSVLHYSTIPVDVNPSIVYSDHPYSYRSHPGLRMASPSQTCSPLRLSSLPTAIGRPGYSADDSFIPRTPDLSRAKISASFLLWFAYGEATTPAWCNTFQLLRHFTLNEKPLTRRTNEAMRWHRRLRTTQSCGFSDK